MSVAGFFEWQIHQGGGILQLQFASHLVRTRLQYVANEEVDFRIFVCIDIEENCYYTTINDWVKAGWAFAIFNEIFDIQSS